MKKGKDFHGKLSSSAWAGLLASILAAACGPSHSDASASNAREGSFLRLVEVIPLPDVEGRIDHLALDLKRARLYVAALENNSLEVIDLASKKLLRQIQPMSEPQGVLYLDDLDRVVVSNGGSGALDVLDGETLERVKRIDVGEDADNLRYEAGTKRVYVAWGKAGAVSLVDASTWSLLGRFEVSAHPEAFQLEEKGTRIFVNVPGSREIEVLDRATKQRDAVWKMASAKKNYPMALIEEDRRLLVGCREPARLIVIDTASGNESAALELSGDCDDIFYDAARARIYVSCGAGSIDVFTRKAAGEYALLEKIPTAAGARTSLFVPETKRLYLAVPHRGEQQAEIRVFEVGG